MGAQLFVDKLVHNLKHFLKSDNENVARKLLSIGLKTHLIVVESNTFFSNV